MKNILLAILIFFAFQTKSQTLCDSISYNIGSGQELILIGENSSSDSVNFQWGVCYNENCYSKTGDTVVFTDIDIFDTVSVCFNISPQWTCEDCQYLVFTNGSWQLINTITHVNEIKPQISNNKMYDLLGREIFEIPLNKIYIKNNKKCIRTK